MKLLIFAAVVAAAVLLPRANAANSDSTAIANDPVVVRGSGFEITRSALDQVLATARAENPQGELPADVRVHAINQLIDIQLVLQKATDAEKAEGMAEADTRFTNIVKTFSPAEFERRLKATQMTAEDLQRALFQEDTAQISLTRQLGIHVTDADAKKWFDDHPGAYDQPETVRIREIVLLTTSDFTTSAAPPLPAETVQAKHKEIFDLYGRVRAGEDFAALAKQYNEDPLSKDNAGMLSFQKNQMEFGDLAYAMKPGQISGVVTNEEGYRFFQLLEIVPPKKAQFADLDNRLKTMLAGKQKRELAPPYLKKLWKEEGVEILDPGLKAEMADADAKAAEAAKAQAEFEARQAAEATNQPPVKL